MPRLEWKVDLGAVIQIVIVLFTLGAGYATLKADIRSLDENGTSVVKTLREEISALKTALTEVNTNMKNLEHRLNQEREDRLRYEERSGK